jgi:hypothetical protein
MNDNWVDITHVGSEYEVQIHIETGRYRYRRLDMNRYAKSRHMELSAAVREDPWTEGHPDGRHKRFENREE